MRRGYAFVLGVAGIGGLYGGQANGQTAPTVDITYTTTAGPVITVGSTFDVSVLAQVENPSDTADGGIFVFSQDFTLSNLIPNTSAAFSVLSVTRPGTDDTDLGGSEGTASTTASGDVLQSDIYGGYIDSTVGIDAPTTLYTVELQAVAAGSATVLDGPSGAFYFTGVQNPDGFNLYDGSYPAADYPAGPTLVAIPVSTPEPATGLVSLVIAATAIRRRRSYVAG